MQQIERVGVIALLFLMVTIVTVALWEDGEPREVQAAETDRHPSRGSRDARADDADERREAELLSVRSRDRERADLPLSRGGSDDVAPLRTRDVRGDRSIDAGGRDALRRDVPDRAPGREEDQLAVPYGARDGLRRPADDGLVRNGFRQEPRRGTGEPMAYASPPEPAPRPAERVPRKSEQAAAPVATAPAPVAGGSTYTVRSGDSFEKISRKTLGDGARWREIQTLNGNIDPRRLTVGTRLALPAGAQVPSGSVTPSSSAPAPSAAPAASGVYVVEKGDVLGKIAQKTLGSSTRWKEIEALNPGLDPRKLHVGMKLKLPAGASAPQPVPARASDSRLVASARSEFVVR